VQRKSVHGSVGFSLFMSVGALPEILAPWARLSMRKTRSPRGSRIDAL
jgi:hypothetical protein